MTYPLIWTLISDPAAKTVPNYLRMLVAIEQHLLENDLATEEELSALALQPIPTSTIVGVQTANAELWEVIWRRMAKAQQAPHRDGSFDHGEEMAKVLAELHGEDHPSVQKARDRGRELKAYENRHNPIEVVRNKDKYLRDNLDADRDLMKPIEMVDDQEMAERRKTQETNERLDKLGIKRG